MLLALQKLDLESDEIRTSREAIQSHLDGVRQVRDRLREDLEQQREQLEATIQLHKEKTIEYEDLAERQKQSKTRLAKVANTKEYSAIEQELENYRRQAGQLEEELVQLLEAIEVTTATSEEKSAKIKALNEEVELESGRAEEQTKELDARLGELAKAREGLAKEVAKEIIRRYSFIRSRRDGLAIVSARNGSCQGCFMQLPPQLYIEIQRAETLHFCPSCQRILFFEEEARAAD